MARIAGVNLPNQKRLEIGLTYIYGIGQPTARKIATALGLSPDTKIRDLTDDEVTKLRNYIDAEVEVEVPTDRTVAQGHSIAQAVEHDLLDHVTGLKVAHVTVRPDA